MESTSVLPRLGHPDKRVPLTLLSWYLIAMVATSTSSFIYLIAMRRVIQQDPTPGLEALTALFWTAGLLSPVIVAVKGLALGGLLWATLALMDVRASFRHCLGTAWSAELLLALPQFVFAMAALARGASNHAQLFVPLGLDLFWSPASAPWAVFSHVANVTLLAWSAVIWFRLRSDGTGVERPWAVGFATAVATLVVMMLPILQLVD